MKQYLGMTFQHIKKNPSPLVYKLAKNPFSYNPRFPKIRSVNRRKEFAPAWYFNYESRFFRFSGKLHVNEGKKSFLYEFASLQEDVCLSVSLPVCLSVSVCPSDCLSVCLSS